jgi:hypothetical protein
MPKSIDRQKLFKQEVQPLIDANYEFIPLRYPGTKDAEGKDVSKVPLHKDWRMRRYTVEEITDHYMKGGNVGVRLGKDDVVLDIDPRNFKSEDELQRFGEEFAFEMGLYPCVLTGGGGFHVYMKKPKKG